MKPGDSNIEEETVSVAPTLSSHDPVNGPLPPLDEIPTIQWDSSLAESNGVVAFDSRNIKSRPFNLLRARILNLMNAHGWRSMGVVSATPGAGKSFVSCNMAAALSRSPGKTVYLVDLDLRRSTIARNFGLEATEGLNGYLAGKVQDLSSVGKRLDGEDLVLVPSFPSRNDSAQLLAGESMKRLMQGFSSLPPESYVICDLPPVFANDDAAIAVTKLDAYVLVVEDGRTTKKQIRDAINILSPARCAGTILNRFHGGLINDDFGYGYGHSSAYGDYYSKK